MSTRKMQSHGVRQPQLAGYYSRVAGVLKKSTITYLKWLSSVNLAYEKILKHKSLNVKIPRKCIIPPQFISTVMCVCVQKISSDELQGHCAT